MNLSFFCQIQKRQKVQTFEIGIENILRKSGTSCENGENLI